MDNNSGYLEVILGPMFSGKTSKLLETKKQYTFCEIPVIAINHVDDTRYGIHQMITHDKQNIDCYPASSIKDVLMDHKEKLESNDPLAVLINEGQFFPDLYDAVYELVTRYKKHVYVAGLDGDYNRKRFGSMLDLIPLCDKVTKLHSLCVYCKNGKKAIFSHRLDGEANDQKLIGSDELYVPLCRDCYDNRIGETCHAILHSSRRLY